MIRYIRKIKKRLIDKNKFKSFITYTLGEIVLVMIGILLALAVNDGYQKSLDRDSERSYLRNIQDDLDEQLTILDRHIAFENMITDHARDILLHYDKKGGFVELEPVYSKLNDMVTRYTFVQSNTTFKELYSSGNIHLIQEDSLRINLVRYYHEMDRVTTIVGQNNSNIIDGITVPAIFDNFIYNREFLSTNLKNILSVDSLKLSAETNDRLIAISEERLQNRETELAFFNILNFRLTISKYHSASYENSRLLTEKARDAVHAYLEEF